MPSTRMETIDAAKAVAYLAKNKPFTYDHDAQTNRPVSMITIRKYAYDMLRNNWRLTNQGLGFDINGYLLDGQQRLMAVVLASASEVNGLGPSPNISFTTLVTYGLDPTTFDYVDVGRNRTSAQVLAMSGVSNPNVLGAAARLILMFRDYPEASDWKRAIITPHDIRAFVQSSDVGDYLTDATGLARIGMINSAAVAAMYLCRQALPDGPHEKFINALKYGVLDTDGMQDTSPVLSPGNPVFAYREYLIRSKHTGGAVRRESQKHLMTYIKAWNDYVRGIQRFSMMWRRVEGIIRPVGWNADAIAK
jgi:hypothetical protein